MTSYLPFVIVAAILIFAMTLTRRGRQRVVDAQREHQRRLQDIQFGTDVITTSGLYGTVVGRNDDDTVQLSIAPGVEVKWALAALEDVASLPPKIGPQPAVIDDSGENDESGEPPSN